MDSQSYFKFAENHSRVLLPFEIEIIFTNFQNQIFLLLTLLLQESQ